MSDTAIPSYPVLLAGGSGTRLWPVSRTCYPKQIARFFGDTTLIQNTVKRLTPVFRSEHIRVVCGDTHGDEIERNLEDIGIFAGDKMIYEPCARNTAPAVLLAILQILETQSDAIIFIFPADHVIGNVDQFHSRIASATSLALRDYIVTFGIAPAYPETGYGYIESSEKSIGAGHPIKRFVEKPDLQTAESYIKAGNFYWNSGMFAFKASVMLEEFERHKPEMLKAMRKMHRQDLCMFKNDYERLESISIDYAVMEQTDRGVVLPSDLDWSDIGSWKSLYDFLPKDKNRNVVTFGDTMLQNTRGSLIMGGDRLVAVNRLDDIVVVDTPDAVFISDLDTSRDVKQIVEHLDADNRPECRVHASMQYRWGEATMIEKSDVAVVRRLRLKPMSELSEKIDDGKDRILMILSGAVQVTADKTVSDLTDFQSIRINGNTYLRLVNKGSGDVHLLEIIKNTNEAKTDG